MANLEDIKHVLQSLLISTKGTLTVYQLDRDFREFEGKPIPYQACGFKDLVTFLKSLTDVLQVHGYDSSATVTPVVDDKVAGIASLVARQRSSQKKPRRFESQFLHRPSHPRNVPSNYFRPHLSPLKGPGSSTQPNFRSNRNSGSNPKFAQNPNFTTHSNFGPIPNFVPNSNFGHNPNFRPNSRNGPNPNFESNPNSRPNSRDGPNLNFGSNPNSRPNSRNGPNPNLDSNLNFGWNPNFQWSQQPYQPPKLDRHSPTQPPRRYSRDVEIPASKIVKNPENPHKKSHQDPTSLDDLKMSFKSFKISNVENPLETRPHEQFREPISPELCFDLSPPTLKAAPSKRKVDAKKSETVGCVTKRDEFEKFQSYRTPSVLSGERVNSKRVSDSEKSHPKSVDTDIFDEEVVIFERPSSNKSVVKSTIANDSYKSRSKVDLSANAQECPKIGIFEEVDMFESSNGSFKNANINDNKKSIEKAKERECFTNPERKTPLSKLSSRKSLSCYYSSIAGSGDETYETASSNASDDNRNTARYVETWRNESSRIGNQSDSYRDYKAAMRDESIEIKSNLRKLVQNVPNNEGIFAKKLPGLYRETFGKPLNFKQGGCLSAVSYVKQFHLDVFHVVVASLNDYLLFDKTKPCPRGDFDRDAELERLRMESFRDVTEADLVPHETIMRLPNVIEPTSDAHVTKRQWIPYIFFDEIEPAIDFHLAFIYDPTKIFVHLLLYYANFLELEDRMTEFYTVPENAGLYKLSRFVMNHGVYCVVYYGGKFQRAQILKRVDAKVLVRTLDCGMAVWCDCECVYYMHKDFGNMRQQAIPAALAGVRPANGDVQWNEESVCALASVMSTVGNEFRARVDKDMLENSYLPLKFSVKGDYKKPFLLNDYLIENHYAEPTDVQINLKSVWKSSGKTNNIFHFYVLQWLYMKYNTTEIIYATNFDDFERKYGYFFPTHTQIETGVAPSLEVICEEVQKRGTTYHLLQPCVRLIYEQLVKENRLNVDETEPLHQSAVEHNDSVTTSTEWNETTHLEMKTPVAIIDLTTNGSEASGTSGESDDNLNEEVDESLPVPVAVVVKPPPGFQKSVSTKPSSNDFSSQLSLPEDAPLSAQFKTTNGDAALPASLPENTRQSSSGENISQNCRLTSSSQPPPGFQPLHSPFPGQSSSNHTPPGYSHTPPPSYQFSNHNNFNQQQPAVMNYLSSLMAATPPSLWPQVTPTQGPVSPLLYDTIRHLMSYGSNPLLNTSENLLNNPLITQQLAALYLQQTQPLGMRLNAGIGVNNFGHLGGNYQVNMTNLPPSISNLNEMDRMTVLNLLDQLLNSTSLNRQ